MGTVKDIDGNEYSTVKIGRQVWMAENLKVTRLNDGTQIKLEPIDSAWQKQKIAAYCWYQNDQEKYQHVYGALYNWYAIKTKKLCPAGWHVPTDAEWEALTRYLGGAELAGGKLKVTGDGYWQSNVGATNTTKFSALPGGLRADWGQFKNAGREGSFWGFDEIPGIDGPRFMFNSSEELGWNNYGKNSGFSVRCLKN